MGRIVVEVMPKPEILDPQGKAVVASLPRLGFEEFTAVRQGRRFELTVEGPVTQAHLDAARQAADTLLSNPIIEDVVAVAELPGGSPGGSPGDSLGDSPGDAAAQVAGPVGAVSGAGAPAAGSGQHAAEEAQA